MSDHDEAPEQSAQRPFSGDGRAAPYGLSRLAGPISLVDVAREIEHANTFIASTTNAQLRVIADQIAVLRDEAQRLLEQARTNAELHRAEARFARHPGKTYHLYERSREDSTPVRYWSLLSPADWGEKPPHAFVGSYRLESDQSWTRVDARGQDMDQLGARDSRREEIATWLRTKLLPGG